MEEYQFAYAYAVVSTELHFESNGPPTCTGVGDVIGLSAVLILLTMKCY